MPTDTVYGVAARLSDPGAVASLFKVKSRPGHVALPVIVSSLDQVAHLTVEWSDDARRLAERFWPGALTIIVNADPALASRVGAASTLGLRRARHEVLSSIIEECGPLAVTSANEHGRRSDELKILPGVCDGAVASVVELTGAGWHLRRAGALSVAELVSVLGPESST